MLLGALFSYCGSVNTCTLSWMKVLHWQYKLVDISKAQGILFSFSSGASKIKWKKSNNDYDFPVGFTGKFDLNCFEFKWNMRPYFQ